MSINTMLNSPETGGECQAGQPSLGKPDLVPTKRILSDALLTILACKTDIIVRRAVERFDFLRFQ